VRLIHCGWSNHKENERHICTIDTQNKRHICTTDTQNKRHICTIDTQNKRHICTIDTQNKRHICTIDTQKEGATLTYLLITIMPRHTSNYFACATKWLCLILNVTETQN